MRRANTKMKSNRTAEDAAADWMVAKNAEIAANKQRIEIEDELIVFLGNKPEGATSHQIGPYKVTLTGRLNRKVDWDILDTLKIKDDLLPVKTKRELDVTGVKFLEEKEPAVYKTLTKALTIEPAKTSVTVIRTEK